MSPASPRWATARCASPRKASASTRSPGCSTERTARSSALWPLLARNLHHHRHVIAEPGAAPVLEAAHVHLADVRGPGARQEDVVDVIGRAVLETVAPVERRLRLRALGLAARMVIGADQPVGLEQRHRVRMIDQVAGFVPEDVVVEVASHDRRPLPEKGAIVAGEGEPQRPRLALATDAV